MNPRTTGILFLVAAALAAFVWLYEIGGEEERQAAEDAQKHLFADVDADAIEWVAVRTSDGRDVRLEQKDSAWQITQPVDFPADRFAAEGLASALAQFASETVLEEPRSADVYGLGDEAKRVRFSVGGVEHVLITGRKTPVGANHYASVEGSDAVYTVATHRVQAFEKELDALREKRIANFETGAVRKLTLGWPDGRVGLERADEGWTLVAPISGTADAETVDSLLSDLSFLRADGFVDEPSAEMAAGFHPAWFSAEIELAPKSEAGEPEVIRIAVGGLDGEERLVRGGQAALYRVAETQTDFPRRLDDYRFRQLALFTAADARRLEIGFASEAGESVAVTATKDGTSWTSTPDLVDSDRWADLVTELSNLRADTILADAMGTDELQALGLDPPRATLVVFGEGEQPETLANLRIGEITSDGISAQITDDPIVFRLAIELAEHLPVSLEAFRNRFVAPSDEADDGADDEALDAPVLDSPPE